VTDGVHILFYFILILKSLMLVVFIRAKMFFVISELMFCSVIIVFKGSILMQLEFRVQ
jgi:hypothetical protein